MKQKYYAYFFDNEKNGIVDNWNECKSIVTNTKARYKSFSDYSFAQNWLNNGALYEKKTFIKNVSIDLEDAVYFDAGTGRGRGVEVRISDKNKNSLIHIIENENFKNYITRNLWFINEFANLELGKSKTNNFGELLGLYLSIECALKLNLLKILGDSKLVIDYWSLGVFHKNKLSTETVSLIKKVIKNRKKFENIGGKIEHISGDINPADLGFHK